jgi:hypothetical protein
MSACCDRDIQKYYNITKKIRSLKDRINTLQNAANNLLTNTETKSKHPEYAIRCITWLKQHDTKPIPYHITPSYVIVERCHRLYYEQLLNNFVFELQEPCSGGCSTWVYNHTTCSCGSDKYVYEAIDYKYGKEVSLDDHYPLYKIVQVKPVR